MQSWFRYFFFHPTYQLSFDQLLFSYYYYQYSNAEVIKVLEGKYSLFYVLIFHFIFYNNNNDNNNDKIINNNDMNRPYYSLCHKEISEIDKH